MVSLLVGQSKTLFNIHSDILCKASPFFTSAFMGSGEGEFLEKSKKSMNLPEDDPEAIDRLIQWIYVKHFRFHKYAIGKSNNYGSVPLMQLATLYVVADKYGVLGLKNEVIDHLWELLGRTQNEVKVDDKIIEYVYENTLAGSKLRKLLVHWQANSTSLRHKNKTKLVQEFPEYAADLLARMSSCRPNPWLESNGKTAYHEHTGDDESERESDESEESDETEKVNDDNSGDQDSLEQDEQ